MERKYIYVFERPKSEDLTPRFSDITTRLQEQGVWGISLGHPNKDYNRIEVSIGIPMTRKLECILNMFGYHLYHGN